MLRNGLYEQVINKALEGELDTTDKLVETAPIDGGESSKVLSKYIAEIIEKGLDNVRDSGGALSDQVELVNKIVATIMTETKEAEFDSMAVAKRAEQLLALFDKKDNAFALNEKAEIVRPETSIAQSSLFTGAIHEPQMFTELKKEIISADRIDMLVSFIKWSGLRLIIDELTAFTQKGGELRIITTSYMGATDVKAVEELSHLPNTQIKVSYDTKRTRLHAKSYVFYRNSGFTTAYVGSSNLSNAAISSGRAPIISRTSAAVVSLNSSLRLSIRSWMGIRRTTLILHISMQTASSRTPRTALLNFDTTSSSPRSRAFMSCFHCGRISSWSVSSSITCTQPNFNIHSLSASYES